MAGLEVDSAPPERRSTLTPRDRIVQRLVQRGVPLEQLEESRLGLVLFVKKDRSLISEMVSVLLPTEADLSEVRSSSKIEFKGGPSSSLVRDLFHESMLWLQWLMFEGEPQATLENLAEKAAGQRAVCGVVWGQNDVAYRCRTCEHDPTCAICVPCFRNGNHKDHDYSIMYTGGGCCDCGDVTAWKREGFCSKHKGTEQIQPLPEDLANSVGPVLDALLVCWKDKIVLVEQRRRLSEGDHDEVCEKVAYGLSSAIVEMLLSFCKCTESLLSFISKRMFECTGLLDVLVRAEGFLDKKVVKKLHELLLKLIGEPLFKYEFAKVFVRHYPVTVSEIIRESNDSMLDKYPLLSTFSVQIFTVPTLTPRLVREVNLLGVLLGCLRDLFLSCLGEDGHLQATKWENLYQTTIRLIEDTRYVLSHEEVPKYIAHERPDISRMWMKLLCLVQGMDAQKRVTGLHTEEENENLPAPFVLGHFLGNVHTLLVQGAFSVVESKEKKDVARFCSEIHDLDDCESLRHTKVGRISQDSSACSISGRCSSSDSELLYGDVKFNIENRILVPSPVIWLILECLKSIESCLGPDTAPRDTSFSLDSIGSTGHNFLTMRRKFFKVKKGAHRVYRTSVSREDTDGDQTPTPSEHHEMTSNQREVLRQNNDSMNVDDISDMYPEHASSSGLSDDSLMEVDPGRYLEAFGVLNIADWPNIVYDVSSQETSFHIPLHRLLSLLLRKALKTCYCETKKLEEANGNSSLPSAEHRHFFGQILGGIHPCGFSAFVMEHPLRLRVFCAQVRAGMWRKNGDAAILSPEWYRSVQWFEQGLESDLFLLQCCAALAPPELFVKRIQERFGLSNYTSLSLAEYNEYEPVLVQEMLTLIIQIVKERRFCGLSTVENLKRELVYKLAVGDATHSQLVKALPRDLSKSDQLQNVVDMVAVYSNPSGLKQGKYSLRKAYWKELDLYHPRWSSRDLQVAEERYFRFCKVSALNDQLPRWTDVFEPLHTISSIAISKAAAQIVHAVLYYAVFSDRSSTSRAPEGVLLTALHLLSLALNICDSQSHTCIEKVAVDIYPSHCNDDSDHANSFPILTYAIQEIDAGAPDQVFFLKNQSIISLLVTLMKIYKGETDSRYSETKHCDISSLIENILKKFAQLSANCMTVLKQLAPDVVCHMLQCSSNTTVQNVASASDAEERKAKARQRQAAIMEKMKAEQSRFIASLKSAANDELEFSSSKEVSNPEDDYVSKESAPLCSLCRDPDSRSPLCFLTLLQKSRLTTFVERGPLSWEDGGPPDKEVVLFAKEDLTNPSGASPGSPAHLVQDSGLEFSFDVEHAEVDAFLDFFKERLPDMRNMQISNVCSDTGTSTALSLEMIEDDIYHSVLGNIHHSESSLDALNDGQKCATSDAEIGSKKSKNIEASVLGEYVVHLSRGTSKQHNSSIYGFQHLANVPSKSTVSTAKIHAFGPSDCDGIHISSCGHAVHQECHDRYLLSLKQRYIRRLGFEGGHIVDPELGELLCPVCRRFANSILPAFPSVSNKSWRRIMSSAGSRPLVEVFSTHLDMDNRILHLPLALSLLQSTAKMVEQGRFLNSFSGKLSESTEPALEPLLKKLFQYYPHNYGSLLESGRLCQSLILWDTLRYSLISTEIAARGRLNSFSVGSKSCLESLDGELNSSSGFILSLLLRVAQSARSLNRLEVLLRFRGIQLLAGSVCSGVSGDNDLSKIDKGRGAFSSLLERADGGGFFPDTQFWKQAADPILSQDPFSSLMWVLFCLPLPFLSSSEFFIPLVHLFYVVSVVQALITCYCNPCFDISSFGDCLLNDICKAMAESELARQYFLSNYIDSSCHPKDMIRRFTFPYLRRCALLWKLLKSSTLSPLYDSPQMWEGSNLYTSSTLDSSERLTVELNGIKELEDMFQIHSLEVILKDEVVHAISLRWCQHFCEEFKHRKYRGFLCSTPAVPFKLMQLPQLYQDLLQRYIKQQCSDCNSVPDEPALCLLCGKLCSPGWKTCCRSSVCFNHAMVCGAGIGVFLLVRKTTILLQRSARQAFWPSPYLDAFGEEDHDVYRGKPLYLSGERYAALTYLVASHALDRTSEVLRHSTLSLYGSD